MSAKYSSSERRRSRPVQKRSKIKTLKKNKLAAFIVIFIVLTLVIGSFYAVVTNIGDSNSSGSNGGYQNDLEYKSALNNTKYPVAVLETSKGVMAIELYTDKMPKTCANFIKLVNDGCYNGMIFHRVKKGFMIQAGSTFPDGSKKTSPYGNIEFESSDDVTHVDGAISMASTAAGVGGSSEFFICDGAQHSLDGKYAAFGKLIYGWSVLREIASAPNDGSLEPIPGGGKPLEDVKIYRVSIVNQ